MNLPAPIKIFSVVTLVALGCVFAKSATAPNSPPVFDADIPTQFVPAGKTLVVPVIAHDPDGNPLSYTVTSSNPAVLARVKTGNPNLKMHVSYGGPQTAGSAAVVTLNFTNWNGGASTVSITGSNAATISIPSGTGNTPPVLTLNLANWDGGTGSVTLAGPNGYANVISVPASGSPPVVTLDFSAWDGTDRTVNLSGPNGYSASFEIPAGTAGTASSFTPPSGWTPNPNPPSGSSVTITYNMLGSGYGASMDDGGASGLTVSTQDGTAPTPSPTSSDTSWTQSQNGQQFTFTYGTDGSGYSISGTMDATISSSIADGTGGNVPSLTAPANWTESQSGSVFTFTNSSNGPGYSASNNANNGVAVSTQDGTNPVNTTSSDPGSAAFQGDLVFDLFYDLTPMTASIIGGLAQGGFYNGLTFHRILSLNGSNVPTSVIAQGGDPLGTGLGGPGFTFNNEFHPGLIYSGKGQLAMANSGFGDQNNDAGVIANVQSSNGSQFFITDGTQRGIDFNNPIFGQLLRGFDTLDRLVNVPVDGNGKPTGPVIIQTAQVVPNTSDAVLFLSAATVGTSSIEVTVSDGTSSSTQTFSAVAQNDTVNDPPFLTPIDNTTAPVGGSVSVPLHGVDLEFDPLFYGQVETVSGTNEFFQLGNNILAVSSTTSGPLEVAAGVYAFGQQNRGNTELLYDFQTFTVGFGATPITAQALTLTTSTSSGIIANQNQPLAIFTDAGQGSVSQYTATVNWGDGSPVASGTSGIVVLPSGFSGHSFSVLGAHTYKMNGEFPVTVTLSDTKGATATAVSTAIVSSGPIILQGVTFPTTGAVSRSVATFTDTGTHSASEYQATVDWGDGIVTAGTVSKVKNTNQFSVSGKHTYKDSEAFSIRVTVARTSATATAWSTADVTKNVAPHFPPLPQGHLAGNFVSQDPTDPNSTTKAIPLEYVINTTQGAEALIRFSIVVLNSGDKPGAQRLAPVFSFTDEHDADIHRIERGDSTARGPQHQQGFASAVHAPAGLCRAARLQWRPTRSPDRLTRASRCPSAWKASAISSSSKWSTPIR
jgi:peptidyl-prolyl cis-trans isomerase A (cyclophilin A)